MRWFKTSRLHRAWHFAMTVALATVVAGALWMAFTAGDRGPVAYGAELTLVAEGFVSPVHLASPPDGSERRMIVDRIGTVYVLMPDGRLLEEPFLDVRDRMVRLNSGYDERGLLGLAFHPQFATNGRVYVHYSAPLQTGAPNNWDHTGRIAEWTVSPDDANRVDPNSERVVLAVNQPQSNHNGGTIAFGPDGYLYIGLGDGGGGNDMGIGHPPLGNGQDVTTLLGSLLRIDVDGGVPVDNPFLPKEGRSGAALDNGVNLRTEPDSVPSGAREEIYAWGFRNPYRFSFDRGGDGHLFVADVGQNLWEEVSIVTGPGNFGWRVKEGSHWFDAGNPSRVIGPNDDAGRAIGQAAVEAGVNGPFVDPIIEYRHPGVRGGETVSEKATRALAGNDGNEAVPSLAPQAVAGISVIGGYVYRGSAMPQWDGKYVFGDWSTSFQRGSGQLFVAAPSNPDDITEPWVVEQTIPLHAFLIGFGEDADGELYVLTTDEAGPRSATGKVYKIEPSR